MKNLKTLFFALTGVLLLFGSGNAWGGTSPVTIYSNTGIAEETDSVTSSGNINTNNGNPKPSFGLTSATKNTITLTGLSLSAYSDITMDFDYKRASSKSTYTSLSVSQYDKNNALIGSATSVTGNKQTTSYQETSIAISSACVKITIICPGSVYGTYVDNIVIKGTPASTKTAV